MSKDAAKDYVSTLRNAAPYMDLGLRFAAAAVIAGGAGYWLDGKLATYPLFMILGIMLGGTAGFINLYRTVMRITQSESQRKKAK